LNCLKDCLEIIYYIAFIGLTCMLVFYARKTYKYQIGKSSTLLCKIAVSENVSEKSEFVFGLEVFNDGNKTAKQIEVYVADEKITTIEYIKPNEVFMFPLGSVLRMVNCNRAFYKNEEEISQGTSIKVTLKCEGIIEDFNINTDVLFVAFATADSSLRQMACSLDRIADAVITRSRF